MKRQSLNYGRSLARNSKTSMPWREFAADSANWMQSIFLITLCAAAWKPCWYKQRSGARQSRRKSAILGTSLTKKSFGSLGLALASIGSHPHGLFVSSLIRRRNSYLTMTLAATRRQCLLICSKLRRVLVIEESIVHSRHFAKNLPSVIDAFA